MMQSRYNLRLIGIALFAAVTFNAPVFEAQEPQENIVFFDPDANHQKIIQITRWFNDYLETTPIKARFRPVQNVETLWKLAESGAASYAIVSSQYLSTRRGRQLEPVLVPAQKDDVYYRKVLVVKNEQMAADLSRRTIAITVSGQEPREFFRDTLEKLEKKAIKTQDTRFLQVKKDIDALLALAFGRVDAAIVTTATFGVLSRLNPVAAKSFHRVGEIDKILRAPLCAIKGGRGGDAVATAALVEAFKKMAGSPDGEKVMSTMAIDSWVSFKPEMMEGAR